MRVWSYCVRNSVSHLRTALRKCSTVLETDAQKWSAYVNVPQSFLLHPSQRHCFSVILGTADDTWHHSESYSWNNVRRLKTFVVLNKQQSRQLGFYTAPVRYTLRPYHRPLEQNCYGGSTIFLDRGVGQSALLYVRVTARARPSPMWERKWLRFPQKSFRIMKNNIQILPPLQTSVLLFLSHQCLVKKLFLSKMPLWIPKETEWLLKPSTTKCWFYLRQEVALRLRALLNLQLSSLTKQLRGKSSYIITKSIDWCLPGWKNLDSEAVSIRDTLEICFYQICCL